MDRVTFPRTGAAVAIAVTWIAAMLFTLAVAAETHVGPVVLRFTPKHGVHLGDVYAMSVAAAAATFVTIWIVGRRRA